MTSIFISFIKGTQSASWWWTIREIRFVFYRFEPPQNELTSDGMMTSTRWRWPNTLWQQKETKRCSLERPEHQKSSFCVHCSYLQYVALCSPVKGLTGQRSGSAVGLQVGTRPQSVTWYIVYDVKTWPSWASQSSLVQSWSIFLLHTSHTHMWGQSGTGGLIRDLSPVLLLLWPSTNIDMISGQKPGRLFRRCVQ